MIPPCPRCGKDDFKKTRDLTAHLKRKFKCKPKPVRPKSPELQPLPRPQSPAPVDHTKRKDRRKNKLQVINPTPVLEPESISQTQVPSPTLQDVNQSLDQADEESFENVNKPEQHPTQQIEDQRVVDPEAGSLHKKTQRAEKIYKLLEKIGLDKIQYIKSYSANDEI
ncbi:hypothetical protein RhiirA4_539725 [Rhizophagus irregularis]|uniref:Uncharacterized protein n=1 Tax=Rhizophagus irregularis TaxID=588596 RepID=A0A2I1G4P6_9GLOM|nr:hypothetical protein RhiirA4_539725 [Rhizophagus irregularis]